MIFGWINHFYYRGLFIKRITDNILHQAYEWLYQQRQSYSHNSDIWHLRYHWQTIKPSLQEKLHMGEYDFSPLQEYRFADGIKQLWCAQDALVLKAISLALTPLVKQEITASCTHVKDNGGLHEAVRRVKAEKDKHDFFIRSDVKRYYASIDHFVLYHQCCELVDDAVMCKLIWQYLKHSITYGGLYWDVEKGISLGCPLSPLMAAIYRGLRYFPGI